MALEEAKRQLETEEELVQQIRAERKAKRARAFNADGTERVRKRRRPKINPEEGGDPMEDVPPPLPITGMKIKKIRISLEPKIPSERKPPKVKIAAPAIPAWPCILCPNEEHLDMVEVMEPNECVKAVCRAVDGVVKAHRACVNSIPETWIERELETGQEWVLGINSIPKDRWNLVSAFVIMI
jgi:hypothetical protein